MGTSTLETAYLNGQIIDASHINELTQALLVEFIGRDSTGALSAGQTLGTTLYPWGDIWGTLLTVAEIQAIKVLDNFIMGVATDAVTTGADVAFPHPGKAIVRATNVGLTSVQTITLPAAGKWLIYINDTTNTLIFRNKAGAITANQINTGTDEDLSVAPGACVIFIYESSSAFWRCIGGAGGGGIAQKKYALTNNQVLTDITGLLLDSAVETSASFILEVERVGAATYRQIINALAVYNGTVWELGFGLYVGDDLIQSTISNTQEIILSLTTGGQFQCATGNLASHVKSNIKITQTRIKT